MRRRAFTLAELLSAMVLAAFMLAMGLMGLRAPATSQQSKLLAQLLVARLGQARQRAAASGEPVALAIPGGLAQNCYLLQGDRSPRRVAVWDWRGELPQAFCYAGQWPLDAPAQWLPTPMQRLNLSGWGVPQPGDSLLAFSPSGEVDSNLSSYNGDVHLLACTGLTGSLDSVSYPYTVHLAPSGSARWSSGLDSGSAVAQPASGSPAAGAQPPGPAGLNANPSLASVEPMPRPAPGSLPDGIDASVRPEGYLTFQVRGSDPDHDVLRCFWTTTRGNFSNTVETRMDWDEASGQWLGRWTFAPPPGADPGDIYELSCTLKDGRGGSVTGTFGVGGRVLVLKRPRLCFSSNADTLDPVRRSLFISNLDGTERKRVFDGRGTLDCPRWSPDGSLLVFLYDPSGGIALDLWVVRPDGSGLKRLIDANANGWALIAGAVFTPDGTKIIATGYQSSSTALVWCRSDGSKPSNPSVQGFDTIATLPGAAAFTGMDVHPTTGHIMVSMKDGSLHLLKTDGTQVTVNQPAPPPGSPQPQVTFSPDGTKIYLNPFLQTIDVHPFTYNGSGPATVGPATKVIDMSKGPAQGPHISFDGQYLFYERGNPRLELIKYDLVSHDEFTLTPPGIFEDDVWSSP
jgi:type II secretory pathway pseudopilin PulG